MDDISARLNELKEKYKNDGNITTEQLQELADMLNNSNISLTLRMEILDFTSDGFMDFGHYQEAYTLVNKFCSKFVNTSAFLMHLKNILIRCEAMAKGIKINLKDQFAIYDNFEKLQVSINYILNQYDNGATRVFSESELERAQEFVNRIILAKNFLEGKRNLTEEVPHDDGTHIKSEKGSITHEDETYIETEPEFIAHDDENIHEDSGDGDIEDDKMGDRDDSVNGEESKIQTDEFGQVENEMTLDTVNQLIGDLEESLITIDVTSPEYLDVLLNMIELQYDKLRMLNQRITELTEVLEKYEEISEKRKKGLELSGKSAQFSDKIQKGKDEIYALEQERVIISNEYKDNQEKVNEVLGIDIESGGSLSGIDSQSESEIKLAEVSQVIGELESKLNSLDERTPEYLDTLLYIIELQDDKLKLLAQKIGRLSGVAEKYEEIFQKRQRGLEFLGKTEELSGRIQSIKGKVSSLKQDEKDSSDKFSQNKEKVSEVLDRG